MIGRPQEPGRPAAHREFEVDENSAGQRLDNFLLGRLKGVPRPLVYRLIRKGGIRLNGRRTRPDRRIAAGDIIRVAGVEVPGRSRPVITDTVRVRSRAAAVLYEDDDLLVIDKPATIAVHAGSGLGAGLIDVLREQYPDRPGLELAHRLDRSTSGVLVLATRRSVLADLQRQFGAAGGMRKEYLALVRGGLAEAVEVDAALVRGQQGVFVAGDGQGRQSRSLFTPLRRFADATLVNIRLHTGRTHQARVHAAALGHPVGGDPRYGDPEFNRRLGELGLQRLFLHAARLRFSHPVRGTRLTVESPLPAELGTVLERLEPV